MVKFYLLTTLTFDTRLGVDIATVTLGLPFRKNVIPEIYRKKWNSREDNPLPGFRNFDAK